MSIFRWIILTCTLGMLSVTSLFADAVIAPSSESSHETNDDIEIRHSDDRERITIAFLSEVLLNDVPDLLNESLAFIEYSAEDWFGTIEIQINLIIHRFDADGDGGLSDKELFNITFTKELGPRTWESFERQGDIDALLYHKDSDSDGRMSVDELIELFDTTLADSVDEFGDVLSSFDSLLELGPFPDENPVDSPFEKIIDRDEPESDL